MLPVAADVMQRAPAFGFDSAREARAFGERVTANFAVIKTGALASTQAGRLHDIEQFAASRYLFPRFPGACPGARWLAKEMK